MSVHVEMGCEYCRFIAKSLDKHYRENGVFTVCNKDYDMKFYAKGDRTDIVYQFYDGEIFQMELDETVYTSNYETFCKSDETDFFINVSTERLIFALAHRIRFTDPMTQQILLFVNSKTRHAL